MNQRTPTKLAPVLGLLGLMACATTKPAAQTVPLDTATTTGSTVLIGNGPATEDLAKYRPTFAPGATTAAPAATTTVAPATNAAPRVAAGPKVAAPAPTSQVNAQMEQRLRDQAYTNEKVKYTSGFRVLVYQGLEREKAMGIRRQIISRYPEEADYLAFKQPVYRLYVGDYASRIEAARGLSRMRQFAPKAELEAMQVLLNKNP